MKQKCNQMGNEYKSSSGDEITVIMSNQKEFTAELLGRDPKADLAVLKIVSDDLIILKIT